MGWSFDADCCCTELGEECECCNDGQAPAFMEVYLLGTVANDDCDDCADWTGQWYRLPQREFAGGCEWLAGGVGNWFGAPEIEGIPCGGALQLQITCFEGDSGPVYQWTLTEWLDSVVWRTDELEGATANCLAEFELTYREDNATWCDWSSVGSALIRPG